MLLFLAGLATRIPRDAVFLTSDNLKGCCRCYPSMPGASCRQWWRLSPLDPLTSMSAGADPQPQRVCGISPDTLFLHKAGCLHCLETKTSGPWT